MELGTSRAFTIRASGRLRTLVTPAVVCEAFDPRQRFSGGTPPPNVEIEAIWDTGAQGSVITETIVRACKLVPISRAKVQGAFGHSESEVYLVNIFIPTDGGIVAFSPVRVVRGILGKGARMLIGMDIIGQGDFAVTNFGDKTMFSFRIPSQGHIDFTAPQ